MPSVAHAYLDPGTGAVLLQAVIASVAGGILIARQYWARLTSFFRRNDNNQKKTNGDEPTK